MFGEINEVPSATRMIHDGQFKLIYYPVGNYFQLFDLKNDPDELINLVHQEEFFGKFRETWYGKRACPCCFLEHDTLVLDSEWHWIFDCVGFAEIRSKMPYLSNCLTEIRKNAVFSEIHDLGNLMNAIQNDSRLGFSTVSFLRRAISQREIFMKDCSNSSGSSAAMGGSRSRSRVQ